MRKAPFVKRILSALSIVFLGFLGFYCSSEKQAAKKQTYLNLHDSVRYVGKTVCLSCHAGAHQGFLETGMGRSLSNAHPYKSAGRLAKQAPVFDKDLNLWYQMMYSTDSMYVLEYRLEGTDTVHKRKQNISYIIGSGQHTNSHLFNWNGYIFQAPLTFYTQKGIWDLPPGFENGFNSRFSRQIGLECMACHNAYPEFVAGSENKFLKIPEGIDCERCHGPGSVHVREKQEGILIDTAKHIDYSIVNPGKLPIDAQFDLCQRCHLQGNAVLKEGKSFFDFKPSMRLNEVMDVYLPRYENDEDHFIMASHADRLKMSSCFKVMAQRKGGENSLRPYKNAMTCVTCHNPHVSVQKQNEGHFNTICASCHTKSDQKVCTEDGMVQKKSNNNCVSCHMPVSGSMDIPHVRVHDHYIRKNAVKENVRSENTGSFLRLECINNNQPDERSKIIAYIQQFEKFDPGKSFLLDSAEALLRKASSQKNPLLKESIHLNFTRKDYAKITSLVQKLGDNKVLGQVLLNKSLNNADAWTAYRIAESYSELGLNDLALPFFNKACSLAPYQFDFANKYASALFKSGQKEKAASTWFKLVNEAPFFAAAWCNLGYVKLLEGDSRKAEVCYKKAIALDPNYHQAWINLVGLQMFNGETEMAQKNIKKLIRYFPQQEEYKLLEKEIMR